MFCDGLLTLSQLQQQLEAHTLQVSSCSADFIIIIIIIVIIFVIIIANIRMLYSSHPHHPQLQVASNLLNTPPEEVGAAAVADFVSLLDDFQVRSATEYDIPNV